MIYLFIYRILMFSHHSVPNVLFFFYILPFWFIPHSNSLLSHSLARMEEGRSAFKILIDKPSGKKPLGRPRRRWEDNIRMEFEEIGMNAGNWVDSAQDRNYWRAFVNAALNLRVP